jgi:hypothetical protein
MLSLKTMYKIYNFVMIGTCIIINEKNHKKIVLILFDIVKL